jgi:hypothetical protein
LSIGSPLAAVSYKTFALGAAAGGATAGGGVLFGVKSVGFVGGTFAGAPTSLALELVCTGPAAGAELAAPLVVTTLFASGFDR